MALALVVLILVHGGERAAAQPFGAVVSWSGTGDAAAGNGWLEVPDSPALTSSGAVTLEGWVDLATPFGGGQACRSLVGKDLNQGYWLGVCGSTLRASFRGAGSAFAAGTVPAGRWTHVAVTFDGVTQTHYVDGEVAGTFPAGGPPTASAAPLRIGGDVSWPYSPAGAMTEVRLWSVARTVDQIRATIGLTLAAPQPGLVAVWSLRGDGQDALGNLPGTWSGTWSAVPPATLPDCAAAASATTLCLGGFLQVAVSWRDFTGVSGAGTVVPIGNATATSGLFWFFAADNWELMVKALDGCASDSSYWVFSAATTDVFYRLEVTDVRRGVTKIYFNYPGIPAPAVTDTTAFPGSCT